MIKEDLITLGDVQIFIKQVITNDTLGKPYLIFLHDSWGCTEMWGDFPEKLMHLFGLNVLVYDRRGYGKSSPFGTTPRNEYYLHHEADFLIQIMDYLKISTAILYGHSDGATIAIIAASVYSDRFRGLILESAHTFIEEEGRASVRESRDKAKHNSLLASLKKFHGAKTDELFKRWHEAWLSNFLADWSIVSLLKNVSCPVLAFRGENDPYDTVEQLYVLKKEIRANITTLLVSNAAHTPRKENEYVTMLAITRFCEELMINTD